MTSPTNPVTVESSASSVKRRTNPLTIGKSLHIHDNEQAKREIYCLCFSTDRLHVSFSEKQGSPPQQSPPFEAEFFGAVGGRFISVYFCHGGKQPHAHLLQAYADNTDDDFYACTFAGRSLVNANLVVNDTAVSDEKKPSSKRKRSENDTDDVDRILLETPTPNVSSVLEHWPLVHCAGGKGGQLFFVAGRKGVIKVLDLQCQKYVAFLRGHSDEILDLKVSPVDEHLLLSASADHSVKLWSLTLGACLVELVGVKAHKDSVLSVAWNLDGSQIASASYDTTVKLWRTRGSIQRAVRQSREDLTKWREERLQRVSVCETVSVPWFCSQSQGLHFHAVDCVQWIGEMLLATRQAIDGIIMLWRPLTPEFENAEPSHQVFRVFQQRDASLYFLRFCTDTQYQWLAAGNENSAVELWSLRWGGQKRVLRWREDRGMPIRYVAFSPSNTLLAATCDNGTIWLWSMAY